MPRFTQALWVAVCVTPLFASVLHFIFQMSVVQCECIRYAQLYVKPEVISLLVSMAFSQLWFELIFE